MAWNPRRSSPQRVYKKSYSLRCHLNGSAWKWTRVPTPSSKKAFLAHLTIVNGPKQAGAAGLERPEGSIREITVTVTRALLHTASSSSTFSPSGSRTGKGRAGARGTFEAARVTPTTLLLSSNAQGSCELRMEEDLTARSAGVCGEEKPAQGTGNYRKKGHGARDSVAAEGADRQGGPQAARPTTEGHRVRLRFQKASGPEPK